MFMTNTLQWAPSIRSAGVVRQPYPDATAAPVHEADIAAVATAALTGDDHAGRVHEISGPESLTVRDQVAVIGRAIARELRFIELSDDEARRQLRRYAPDEVVDSLLVLQRSLVGRPAPVHPTVERVTGRPARRFADWVDDNLDDFG
jgi:uncharacterized protein YbjT (DUF2867 family)